MNVGVTLLPRPFFPQKETRKKLYPFLSSPFRLVYQNIFAFSHRENELVTFTLDEEANKVFEDFVDTIAATLNRQWAENLCSEDISKDDRHVLRLAAVMHVLYDQLEKQFNRSPNSPPPGVIKAVTVNRAIKLTEYFAQQRKVLDQVSSYMATCSTMYHKLRQ